MKSSGADGSTFSVGASSTGSFVCCASSALALIAASAAAIASNSALDLRPRCFGIDANISSGDFSSVLSSFVSGNSLNNEG